jgi:hypothetical protein
MSWSEAREAELRDSGWSEGEIRDFRRGYERGPDLSKESMSTARPAPLPAFTGVQAPRVVSRGDRGTWARSTVAGKLASVVSPDAPDEGARELAAAKKLIDDHEFTYGRRPSVTEARMVVGRRSDGAVLGGTAEEIGRVFAMAGLPFGIETQVKPLPQPSDAVHQPVVRG